MFDNVPILYPLSSLLYRIAMSNDPHDLQKPLPFNEGDRYSFQLLTDSLVRMLKEIAKVPNVLKHSRQRTCNSLFSFRYMVGSSIKQMRMQSKDLQVMKWLLQSIRGGTLYFCFCTKTWILSISLQISISYVLLFVRYATFLDNSVVHTGNFDNKWKAGISFISCFCTLGGSNYFQSLNSVLLRNSSWRYKPTSRRSKNEWTKDTSVKQGDLWIWADPSV